ncbi:MAG: hypothetical protein ACREVE_03140 [Gammaproteobacteria bacterium]
MTESDPIPMRKRRIALKDGRYMIFYTFEDETGSSPPEDAEARHSEPEPGPMPPVKDQRDV